MVSFRLMFAWKLFLGFLSFSMLSVPALASVTNEHALDLVQNFNSGNKPVFFVFCRDDRSFHCLSVIRNSSQKLMMATDSSDLWTLPILAASDDHRAYNETHGATPQGIFTVNGVMPVADQNSDFGQFRRLILNFLPADAQEAATLAVLPASFSRDTWWKEASVARDMGRNEFRIHGVGYLNTNPNDPSYPFVPTWGCLTTREGLYNGVQYQDQRVLLDSLMTAQGLQPSFQNESLINGYVVVLNLNGNHSDVQLEDLNFLQNLQ